MAKLRIDRGELICALEAHGLEVEWYLDLETGGVLPVIDGQLPGDDDELQEAFEADDGRFLPIEPIPPSLGYDLMAEFAASVRDPAARRALEKALAGRRPFGRFKDALDAWPDLREEWFAFYDQALESLAVAWLEDQGIDADLAGPGAGRFGEEGADPAETSPRWSPPLDRLLTLGEPDLQGEWADYLALGFGPQHIPELLRMVTDVELNDAPTGGDEVWAPLHAWRALGQLRAPQAVEAMLAVLGNEESDDWLLDDLPRVAGMAGPAAMLALEAVLAGTAPGEHARAAAAEALGEIGKAHPEARAECVRILAGQLDLGEADDFLNGFLVAGLLDLKAVEAATSIERAFAEERVDLSVVGDWEDVQVGLGLLEKRLTPAPGGWRFAGPPETDAGDYGSPPATQKRSKREKTCKKMAKASKRKNRKKR